MATRTTRMRPLDHNKPLEIIRMVDQLDAKSNDEAGLGGRELEQNIEALDKQRDEARAKAKAHQQSSQDIPIPTVILTGSYNRDYLPNFQHPTTYVRGRGAVGYLDEGFIEYDLDAGDYAWLDTFNEGQNRLPSRRFEMLMWRLEVANAEATESVLAGAGASHTERQSAAALAAVDHMSRDHALTVMQAAHPLREATAQAVYAYWREKRIALKKPLLRRLHAPTNASDSNPMLVFRPREKIHRPQTRRRRDNNEESIDKLRAIRQNLAATRDLCEAVARREQRKLNIMFNEVDMQQLQLRLRHEPHTATEAVMQEYLAAAKAKPPHRPIGFESTAATGRGAATATSFNAAVELRRLQKKRKRDTRKPDATAIALLPPPPQAQDPDMLFAALPDPSRLPQGEFSLPPAVDRRRVRARIGRGGRLIFDRSDALTLESLYEPAQDVALSDKPSNGPGDSGALPSSGLGNDKVPKRSTDAVKPLWKTANPYAPPKDRSAGGDANAGAGKEQSRGEHPHSAPAPSSVPATDHAAGRADPSHARLRDTNAAALPGHVRAARDAIGSLLANSGSQARAAPLPHAGQASAAAPPSAAAHQAQSASQHLQSASVQMPVLKRGPGRPPKLKTGVSMSADDKGHRAGHAGTPRMLPHMEMV